MGKEVTNEQILQAINELSSEIKEVNKGVKENTDKIDKLDAKLSVLSDGLLNTQADVKILKNAK